jgi:hypothetical protein
MKLKERSAKNPTFILSWKIIVLNGAAVVVVAVVVFKSCGTNVVLVVGNLDVFILHHQTRSFTGYNTSLPVRLECNHIPSQNRNAASWKCHRYTVVEGDCAITRWGLNRRKQEDLMKSFESYIMIHAQDEALGKTLPDSSTDIELGM